MITEVWSTHHTSSHGRGRLTSTALITPQETVIQCRPNRGWQHTLMIWFRIHSFYMWMQVIKAEFKGPHTHTHTQSHVVYTFARVKTQTDFLTNANLANTQTNKAISSRKNTLIYTIITQKLHFVIIYST